MSAPPTAPELAWYRELLERAQGEPQEAFVQLATPVVLRTLRQVGLPRAAPAVAEHFSRAAWQAAVALGIPAVDPAQRPRDPIELNEAALQRAMADYRASCPFPPHRQFLAEQFPVLLRLLLQPDFVSCRLSYQRREADGTCSRQTVEVARRRLSGVHCEDCPFFLSLDDATHRKALERKWQGNPAALAQSLELFLPDDFRPLRRFAYLYRVCARG